jgi:hypothetical protein
MQPLFGSGRIERVQLPSGLLYVVQWNIFPAERMFVGALRRGPDGYLAEAAWDVTGRTSAVACAADPEKLVAALGAMDAAGSFFGLLAHSHPGNSPRATTPSRKDHDAYAARLALGESPILVGAVFAGNYVQFFGNTGGLEVTGAGVRPINGDCTIYEFTDGGQTALR